MSALDTLLPHASAAFGVSARSPRSGSAPLIRLLAGVALASGVAGAASALGMERLIESMQPPLPMPAATAPAMVWSLPALPAAVHDVLRDRAAPPTEPPPAS